MDDRTQQVLLERKARFMSLNGHPGWDELCEEIERERQRAAKRINAELVGGLYNELPQHAAYYRGFVAALDRIRSIPANAETVLKRAMTEAKSVA